MATATKDLPALPDLAAEDAPKQPPAGVFRRLTSKLRSPSQSWVHVSPAPAAPATALDEVQEEPEPSAPAQPTKKDKPRRKISTHMLSLPGASHRKAGLDLENAFTSPEQRQAALRAAGLVPGNAKPGRDTQGYMLPLSEQEKMLDRDFSVVPGDAPRSSEERESEAQRIKEAWMKKNSDGAGGYSSREGSRSPDRAARRRRKGEEVEREQQRERERTESPSLPPTPPKKLVLTTDQIRARRGNDPVFAPQGLMEAMQAYRPQNYRPPPGRKPTGAIAPVVSQRIAVESPSDTDSDEGV